jgi:hypothetical protein
VSAVGTRPTEVLDRFVHVAVLVVVVVFVLVFVVVFALVVVFVVVDVNEPRRRLRSPLLSTPSVDANDAFGWRMQERPTNDRSLHPIIYGPACSLVMRRPTN